jgi:hypothetical protein
MITSALLFLVNNPTQGDVAITFKDGSSAKNIKFDYAGNDFENAQFEFSVNSTISSGSFKIKGMEYKDSYPANVTINVGADNDLDWAFNDNGYGDLGFQHEFASDKKKEILTFTSNTFNNNASIILPRNAIVSSAYMTVKSGKGNILIVEDGGDSEGAAMIASTLYSIGYNPIQVSSESNLPSDWDDPAIYQGIFWFGGTSTSSGYPTDNNAAKMITYAKTGGGVLTAGVAPDYTSYPGNPGTNEVDYFDWVTHHYVGNQWNGGGYSTTSNTYKYTYPTSTTHDIFNKPNTLPSYWQADTSYSASFYYSPSYTANSGAIIAKAGSSSNSDPYGDIIVYDGPSYNQNYGRTVCVRHPIAKSWISTNQGNILIPFIQNAVSWMVGEKNTLSNIKLDIGDVGGAKDWTHPDPIDEPLKIGNFAQKFNQVLPTLPYFEDDYGNKMVKVPLNFTASTAGSLIIYGIEIKYDYDAVVNKNPEGDLASELNEHIIASFNDPAIIPLLISTDAPGQLNLFDVNIIFNNPPKFIKNIEDLKINEDEPNYKLLNLTDHFSDSDEEAWLLNFSVVSNTQKVNLEVSVNDDYLQTIPIVENWNGVAEVEVRAKDSAGKSITSNKFKITVLPMNDEPFPSTERLIPDVTIKQGEIDKSIELENMGYFIDVDNDKLYFDCEVDPLDEVEDEDIDAYINNDDVLFIMPGEYWYGNDIKIWIYADDDNEVNTVNDGGYYCYQEIEVDVAQVKTPPKWDLGGIPDIYRYEDDSEENLKKCLDLQKYVYDSDTPMEQLSFNIIENTNKKILVGVDSNDYIYLTLPEDNYHGSTTVTVRVEDLDYYADEIFNVHILPVNDLPVVEIISHKDGDVVDGVIEIYGTCEDVEDTVNIVEIKIGIFDWQPTLGVGNYTGWNYTWDTTMVLDDDYFIQVRAFDGEDFSDAYVNLIVENGQNEYPYVLINSPETNSVVSGEIQIEGNAFDVDGEIASVEVKVGNTKWLPAQGAENWTYYWDTTTVVDGKYPIYVRASDGFQYSSMRSITLDVDNGITEEDLSDKSESILDNTFIIILIIIVVVVVLIAVVIIARSKRKSDEQTAQIAKLKEERVLRGEDAKPISSPPEPKTAVPIKEKDGYKVAKPLSMNDAKPAKPLK